MTKTPNVHHSKGGSKPNDMLTKMDYFNSRNSYDGNENDSIGRVIDSLNEQSNNETNYETFGDHRSKSGIGHHAQYAPDINGNSNKKRNSKTARSKWREFKVSSDFNSRQALKKVKKFNEIYNKHNI